MKRAEFLQTVRKEIHYIFARNEIEKELEQHINESIEDMIADGMSFDEAEELAVLQMGDAKEIGHELNKVHNPLMGYLILLTRCVLVLMIYPLFMTLVMGAYSLVYTVFPLEREEYVEKYEVNMSVDTPVHHLKVDDLYFYNVDDNECSLTLRTFQKFWKTRASNNFDIQLKDKAGNTISTASAHFLAGMVARHEIQFSKDEMSSIFIHTGDGQILEISLEEEAYETK